MNIIGLKKHPTLRLVVYFLVITLLVCTCKKDPISEDGDNEINNSPKVTELNNFDLNSLKINGTEAEISYVRVSISIPDSSIYCMIYTPNDYIWIWISSLSVGKYGLFIGVYSNEYDWMAHCTNEDKDNSLTENYFEIFKVNESQLQAKFLVNLPNESVRIDGIINYQKPNFGGDFEIVPGDRKLDVYWPNLSEKIKTLRIQDSVISIQQGKYTITNCPAQEKYSIGFEGIDIYKNMVDTFFYAIPSGELPPSVSNIKVAFNEINQKEINEVRVSWEKPNDPLIQSYKISFDNDAFENYNALIEADRTEYEISSKIKIEENFKVIIQSIDKTNSKSIPVEYLVDPHGPYIITSIPANGQKEVSINTGVEIVFNEDLDASFLPDKCELVSSKGNKSGKINYSNKKIEIDFDQLDYEADYKVEINESSIIDTFGNQMIHPLSIIFSTEGYPLVDLKVIAGNWKTSQGAEFIIDENGVIHSLYMKLPTNGHTSNGSSYKNNIENTFDIISVMDDFTFTANYLDGPNDPFSSKTTTKINLNGNFPNSYTMEFNWTASVNSKNLSSSGSGKITAYKIK